MAKQRQPLEDLATQLKSQLKPSALDPIEAAKAGGEVVTETRSIEHLEQAELPEPELPDPMVSRTADVYEVERDIVISWGTQTLRLRSGDKLSEDSYGDGAIARFRERGVALKKA